MNAKIFYDFTGGRDASSIDTEISQEDWAKMTDAERAEVAADMIATGFTYGWDDGSGE